MPARHQQFVAAASRLFGSLKPEALAEIEPLAEWISVVRGETLFRQGDPSDGIYVAISGRFQIVRHNANGSSLVIGEAAPGESIGEMGFFTKEPRTASVVAIRDALLVRFSNDAFEKIITLRPEIVRDLMRQQIGRMQHGSQGRSLAAAAVSIALVPLRLKSSFRSFVDRLTAAMDADLHLTSAEVDRQLGPGTSRLAEHDPQAGPLVSWLNQRESVAKVIVYEADPEPSEWTERCLRQADHIVLVADAAEDPAPAPVERLLTAMVAPRRTLVLLHANGERLPTGTKRWLAARTLDEHHHVRLDRAGDFERVARFLAGRAVGLVLGGGGARGFAHIGVLRALAEAGVPIDLIGGTSMGAALAAQHAMGWTPEKIEEVNRQVFVETKPQSEYTVPIMSLLSSRGSARAGEMLYGDVEIEDLWIRFFCVSSNLSTATAMIHRRGPLRFAVTASASLPGVTVPVLVDGQLLVDGALLNNVPGDLLAELGCGRTMISEVSVEQDQTFTCERVPTVWEVVSGRFRRKKPSKRFPSMLEILVRAAMLASIRREQETLKNVDLSFHPPINDFALMDFDSLHELVKIGYDYARAEIEGWRASGRLAKVLDGPDGMPAVAETASTSGAEVAG